MKEHMIMNIVAITMAENYLISTPQITKMKLLQLRKLSELSGHLDLKLYLLKSFVPKVRIIMAKQSSDYAKEKLLDIIASICHFDEAIKIICKDVEFVQVIFRFLGTCSNNFRLQLIFYKLFHLIACEIQSNPESDWLTDGTNFLERLFDINDLINILTRIPYLHRVPSWSIMEKWLSIVTKILKIRCSKSFMSRELFENDVQCLHMLYRIMILQNIIEKQFWNSIISEFRRNRLENSSEAVNSTAKLFVPMFVKTMDLLLSFPATIVQYIKHLCGMLATIDMYLIEYLPSYYEDKLDLFRYYITEVRENISPDVAVTVQYVERCLRHFLPTINCKQFLEELIQLETQNRKIVLILLKTEIRNIKFIVLNNLKKIDRCCEYTM